MGATRSHGGHSQLHTTMMKGGLFLLGTVATIAAGAGTYETELLRGIDIYNFRSKCWGKKNVDMYAVQMEKAKRECMQMEPAFDFPGHSEGLVDVDEDDFYEYLQQVNDHRHYKQNAMGNLTCVLQKCGMLTEDMEVNMDFYTTGLTAEEAEYGFTWDVEGSAAKDPEWRAKIATAYQDCHDLAESWPATSLNRRPSFWRTWRPSTGQRAMRRLPRGSPASACRKTSTMPPPSPWPSSRTLCLRRRSSSKGSSGTSTGTAPCKQTNLYGASSELNVRELDFHSR